METISDQGLIEVNERTSESLKNQDKADKKSNAGAPEPLDDQPEMSPEFKRGLARSNKAANGSALPSFWSVEVEEPVDLPEPKTFLESPIDWFLNKLSFNENQKENDSK